MRSWFDRLTTNGSQPFNYDKKESVNQIVNGFMAPIRAVYQKELENTLREGGTFPLAEPTFRKIRETITAKVKRDQS